MKKLVIIGLALFLVISCSKKNETVNQIDPNAESAESIMAYSMALSSHDSLVSSKAHHDASGMRHHDTKYHHHDSLFTHHHGKHQHADATGKHHHDNGHHISHHGIDSLHKIHPNYHPQ